MKRNHLILNEKVEQGNGCYFADYPVQAGPFGNEENQRKTSIWYRIMDHDGCYSLQDAVTVEFPLTEAVLSFIKCVLQLHKLVFDPNDPPVAYAPMPVQWSKLKREELKWDPDLEEYKTLARKLPNGVLLNELPDGIGLSSGYFIIIKLPIVAHVHASVTRSTLSILSNSGSALDGVNPNDSFNRNHLLSQLKEFIATDSPIILLSSSAASGKTSLLNLLEHDLFSSNLYFIQNISCLGINSLQEALSVAGISFQGTVLPSGELLYYQPPPMRRNRIHIIILDDAQNTYADSMWNKLLKVVCGQLLGFRCKIIVSAEHALKPGRLSPANLKLIARTTCLTRSDFMLSPQESFAFLSHPKCGLNILLQNYENLKKLIVEDCNGLIGALRVVTLCFSNEIAAKKRFNTEAEAIEFVLSSSVTSAMSRCYGSGHSTQLGNEYLDILRKLFLTNSPLVPGELKENDKVLLADLIKCGILMQVEENFPITFASNMARRYYFSFLYSLRSPTNPDSVNNLVIQSIQRLPAHKLSNAIHENDFPNEATFQHLFMIAMARCTTVDTLIMPELGKSFQLEKIKGRLDFYIDGSLRWGVELLVRGRGIGEHLDRFDGNVGVYRLLNCAHHVVVDFIVNDTGEDSGRYKRAENLITVIFKVNDYSQCVLLIGQQDTLRLSLDN